MSSDGAHPTSTLPVGRILLRGSLWTTVGEVLAGLALLATGILAARLLTPHDFGIMGAVMLALTIIDQFSQTGFQSALVQREHDVESYLDVVFTWHLIRGACMSLLLVVLAPWLGRLYAEPTLVPVMRVVAIHPLLGAATNIGQIYFHRKLDFRALALMKLGQTALRIATFVPALLYFKNVWALVLGVLASALSAVIISYIAHPYRPSLRWDTKRLRELIRYGKWLTGFAAIGFFISYGDNLFVSKYLGLAVLGVYQLAYEISNFPTVNITHVLGRIAFPTYSRLQRDPQGLRHAFVQVMRAALLLSGPVSVLLFAAAADLIHLVFGEKWAPAVPLIRILVIAGLIRSFTALAGPIFHATGRTDLDFKMNLPRFFCTVLGLWPAAHWLGLDGVCYVVLLAVATTLPTFFAGVKRLTGLGPIDVVRENLLAVSSSVLLAVSYALIRPRFGAFLWDAIFGLLGTLLVWLFLLRILAWLTPYDFFAELRRLRAVLRAR
jgi:O-antigen/teichoic acid export membrane protein